MQATLPRNTAEYGDSFEIMTRLPDKCVDLILTDPPYDLTEEQQVELQLQAARISRHGIVCFCAPENQLIKDPDQFMFWIKPISTKNTSRRYSRFVEMILLKDTTVWNHDRHWSQYTNVAMDLVQGLTDHPYEKPLPLIERLLLNHSDQGMLVFDPFAGSGTLGEACRQNGRDYYLIEADRDRYEKMIGRLGHAE